MVIVFVSYVRLKKKRSSILSTLIPNTISLFLISLFINGSLLSLSKVVPPFFRVRVVSRVRVERQPDHTGSDRFHPLTRHHF